MERDRDRDCSVECPRRRALGGRHRRPTSLQNRSDEHPIRVQGTDSSVCRRSMRAGGRPKGSGRSGRLRAAVASSPDTATRRPRRGPSARIIGDSGMRTGKPGDGYPHQRDAGHSGNGRKRSPAPWPRDTSGRTGLSGRCPIVAEGPRVIQSAEVGRRTASPDLEGRAGR